MIKHIDIPVIVIVGIKLGCLNHAILTMKALEQKEQRVFGWIANMVDPNMTFQKENIAHLKSKIKIELIITLKIIFLFYSILDIVRMI